MAFIYSTLTCDNEYTEWKKTGDQQSAVRSVLIKGGHGVMNKNFLTPLGIVTEVSDDDMRFLMNNSAFKFHLEGGFLKVEEKSYESEKVAADMTGADASAQLTPADFEEGGRAHVPGGKAPKSKAA